MVVLPGWSTKTEERGATVGEEGEGTRRTIASLAIHPLLGPTLGGTTVQLHGISFEGGDDLRCRFYDADPRAPVVVPAVLIEPEPAAAQLADSRRRHRRASCSPGRRARRA